MTKARKRIVTERRDTIQAEQELFAQPDIWRVRILGVNALGILHTYEAKLLSILRNGGVVEVLLLDPQSAEFRKRRDREEKRKGRVSNRLLAEMEASVAILQDLLNLLLHQHEHDVETLKNQFQVRLYDRKADKALLFVDTPTYKAVLHRKHPLSSHEPRNPSKCLLVSADRAADCEDYSSRLEMFEEVWKEAEVVSLDDLESNIRIISPRKRDAPHIYSQAVELHEKRRLDEASTLYETVLRLEKPRRPTAEQASLARRFLPRVNATRSEPFGLKDLVIVIHPGKRERLVGYHLIWEDDIDFLTDNDPADHEIIWIKYSTDLKVEGAWSYWHGAILSTSMAVPAANSRDCRVQAYVQWGKHASLLEGWQEKIGVDSPLPGYSEFSSLEFSRLRRERHPAEGPYAERWPKRFEGELDEFIDFPVEVDLEGKLAEHNMIVVSRFANAVISQWYLPYNFYPKTDWPHDAGQRKHRFVNGLLPLG